MITVKEILDYVDELIDDQAEHSRNGSYSQKAIATGVILCLEDLKIWINDHPDSLEH